MLRVTIALLVAIAAGETAEGADKALKRQSSYHGGHRATVILPAGLPRPHYNFRTTISYGPASAYRRSHNLPLVYETPEPYAPIYVEIPTIAPLFGAPVVPGSLGYYGSSDSYGDQGPYFGGPYVPYWDRLPYACGVYGYC